MIQRPQTLYFIALIAIAVSLMFADFSFYTTAQDAEQVVVEFDETKISADGETDAMQNRSLFYLLGLVSLLALVAVFTFKNRKLQGTLASLNFVAILMILVFMYTYSYQMNYFETTAGSLAWPASIPILMLIVNFLALKGIRKDAQIIRSMDRFR